MDLINDELGELTIKGQVNLNVGKREDQTGGVWSHCLHRLITHLYRKSPT